MSDTLKTTGGISEPETQKTITASKPPIPLPRRERASLAKTLPTDRITFDKQVEVVRAYAAVYAANDGQPVTNEQAGEIVGLSGSTISQSNAFFDDIGLVTRAEAGGFIPSAEVIEYNNACQWDESEARGKLRPLFERAWFYRCLVPRLQLAPQSQTTCLALLASESKAQTEHNERLLNLIKFLELAGIISTNGGNVSLLQNRPVKSFGEIGVEAIGKEGRNPPPPNTPKVFSDHEENSFYLDKDKKKRITLVSPLFLTRTEFKRLTTWIESTLIVEDEQKNNE